MKEMELKWSPFWVQIFNLPLRCRTKETAWAIRSKLGFVMEVGVANSRVQWSKYLRVRVRTDITKKLVRRKKVNIEGEESKWIQFKYVQLPSFRYRCGLLNHAIRDCLEPMDTNCQSDEEQLQNGAWLRGEPSRMGGMEMEKQSKSNGLVKGKVSTGGESEKRAETTKSLETPCESNKAYVSKLTTREDATRASEKATHELSYQHVNALHEKGKGNEGSGK